jgi:hypothetical protein
MPRKPVTAGHLPDRHCVDVSDQLTGQAPGHMGAPPQDDLGVVLPVPLRTLGANEPAAYPHQGCRPAMGRQIPHPKPTRIVDPSRLEPAMRAAHHPPSVDDLDHQPLYQIHQHRHHPDATQMQTDRHTIGLHQGPFLARRLRNHRVSRGPDFQPGIFNARRLPTSPRSLLKTQAASRLHAVLATLLPVGMSGELSSVKASRMLRRVRPKTMVETERKRIAHQHLGEVRRLEKEKKASRERLAVAVEASGTGLTDMPPPAACCDGHEQPQTPNTGPPEDGPTGSDPESDSTRQGAQLIARKCPRSRPRSPAYHAIGASWARENFGKASRDAQLESKRESGYLFDAALPGKRPDRRGCPQRVTFDRTPHSGDADGGPCGLCSFSHVMFDLRRSAGRTRPREGTWAKGQRRTSLPFPLGLGLSVMSTSTDCG